MTNDELISAALRALSHFLAKPLLMKKAWEK
jgi:hypothetical protein